MPARPSRRTFVKLSTAAATLAASPLALAETAAVLVVLDPALTADPVLHAAARLREALTARSLTPAVPTRTFTITVALAASSTARAFNPPPIPGPETVALVPTPGGLLVTSSDTRGLAYGLFELTDRVRLSDDPLLALHLSAPLVESSPNRVRSVARAFLSEIEDKPWFYDRAFWSSYLDTLAASRFNRFNLAFGFGWDFPRNVTGDYLHFPYPYLLDLPAYPQVRVDPPLAPGERQRNLENLQYIAAETARRGLDFQLGLWTHAYQWTDSPHSDHRILGLTPETHAAYCRDALAALLSACPQITGLTLRIHGESGIPEGSYGFWQTLFQAVTAHGPVPATRTPDNKYRPFELDLHAKGLDPRMIALARATGARVTAGAKFSAEHQGLSYHQADIRATEYPRAGVTGAFALSSRSRQFTRYGYGDFYQQDLGIDLLYRVWPGTQRHLLWADPALAAGYGRAANFCGAAGLELCEPLTFKGREGSGHPNGRLAYKDLTLATDSSTSTKRYSPPPTPEVNPAYTHDLDSAKFTLTYLTWGRFLYNPDANPSPSARFIDRHLRATYGSAGPALGEALAAASRILPLITTAWCPSASNHEYWPEMLTPPPLLPPTGRPLYTDSPAPHNISAISPLDPQLFSSIAEHAQHLVSGASDPRYNPREVVTWLNKLADSASKSLALARSTAGDSAASTPDFRRAETDIEILIALGRFYANLFRAALFYSIHTLNQDPRCAAQSLDSYRDAHTVWLGLAGLGKTAYDPDISYGAPPFRRGTWADRLPAIESDLAAFTTHFGPAPAPSPAQRAALTAKGADDTFYRAMAPALRAEIDVQHTPPTTFHPGADLSLTLSAPPSVTQVILWYRHVNHAERWLSGPMQTSAPAAAEITPAANDIPHTATIPAAYTASPYPLQYYFELRTPDTAILHPPLNATLSNQPYFSIPHRT